MPIGTVGKLIAENTYIYPLICEFQGSVSLYLQHGICNLCQFPGAVDPWVIQPRERERYEEQFKSLKPVNGIVTGEQAKGFLLQSQLPPQVLGVIWYDIVLSFTF